MKATLIPKRQQSLRLLALYSRQSTAWVRSSWEWQSGLYPAVPAARLIRLQIRPMSTSMTRMLRLKSERAPSRKVRMFPMASRQAILNRHRRGQSASTRNNGRLVCPKKTSCNRRKVRWTPPWRLLSLRPILRLQVKYPFPTLLPVNLERLRNRLRVRLCSHRPKRQHPLRFVATKLGP